MVDAAVELLGERPADRITVRDVAERAGHHHRFVATWFGGKIGLFRAAFEQMTVSTASTFRLPTGSEVIGDEAVRLVQLMNWLVANDPIVLSVPRETPLLDMISAAYQQMGIGGDDARLLAQRLIAAITSFVLFAGPLGVVGDDIRRHLELERRIVARLVEGAEQNQRDRSGHGSSSHASD